MIDQRGQERVYCICVRDEPPFSVYTTHVSQKDFCPKYLFSSMNLKKAMKQLENNLMSAAYSIWSSSSTAVSFSNILCSPMCSTLRAPTAVLQMPSCVWKELLNICIGKVGSWPRCMQVNSCFCRYTGGGLHTAWSPIGPRRQLTRRTALCGLPSSSDSHGQVPHSLQGKPRTLGEAAAFQALTTGTGL